MKRKTLLCAALAGCVLLLPACAKSETNAQMAALSEVSLREAIIDPDPDAAVEAIYAPLENRKLEKLDDEGLAQKLGVSSQLVEDYVAYTSDATAGLCDVAILRPVEEQRAEVRELLYTYKEKRVEEYRNYDILDAYEIAQNAVVYDQGDYLILLMLPDNEAAQEIVDQHIPQ